MKSFKGFSLILLVCVCFVRIVSADLNSTDYTLEASAQMSSASSSFSLGFDPNDYDFLVYDCGTGEIQGAMNELGLTYTLRNNSNPVTAQDLNNYDILIIGWKTSSNGTNGLDTAIIEEGITGRVILTGHDTDWHTINGTPHDTSTFEPADIFLSQCIEYILNGGGTGLLAHAQYVDGYDWLPDSWGIEVTDGLALENVTAFTQDGLNSGVFDDLTPPDMSYWYNSFHNSFDKYGIGFKPFEMGMVGDANSVITIAATVNPQGFPFTKVDDVSDGDCRSPEDEITYTICWENSTDQTFTDVWIIDYLPDGVDYPNGQWQIDPNDPFNPIAPDPGYDPNTHTYVWDIGTITPDDANCVTLTVTVNYKAEPGLYLHNIAEIWTGNTLLTKATEDTLVCCWDITDPNVIYVNEFAKGNDTGVDWENAYSGQDGVSKALNRANNSECNSPYTIYVAQGLYKPGKYETSSFVLPDGTSIYGGYKIVDNEVYERNPEKYETILSGYIKEDTVVETIIEGGNNTLIDGFVIREAKKYGIHATSSNLTIKNSFIQNALEWGLYTTNCNCLLEWNTITNNTNGVFLFGINKNVEINNCEIVGNDNYSIRVDNSMPTIKNSVIWNSTNGININNPSDSPVLYNNTIGLNTGYGVSLSSTDPNFTDYPDMDSCIVWYNGEQVLGFNPDTYATNCCIQDCNGVNDNYTFEPGFAYLTEPNNIPDPNNYHLAWDSPCKNLGNPLFGTDELDIDGENRIYGTYVDIGADEVYSCDDDLSEDDIYNEYDWDADGIINLTEFSKFSAAWLSRDPNEFSDPNLIDPNDSINWNPVCNIVDTGSSTYVIDLDDIMEFINDDWLWIACWKKSRMERFDNIMAMMSGGGESMMMAIPMMEAMSIETVSIEEQPIMSEEERIAHVVLGIYEINSFLDDIINETSEYEELESIYKIKEELDIILSDMKTEYYKNNK